MSRKLNHYTDSSSCKDLEGMGSGCTKCCGKIQDWCRDSCGCCPCKCCKTVQPEVKIQKTIEHKIERKEIPFGHGVLHSGIKKYHKFDYIRLIIVVLFVV